ncbi:hypothetical protein EVA_06832, partial [gut metagenome]
MNYLLFEKIHLMFLIFTIAIKVVFAKISVGGKASVKAQDADKMKII